MKLHSRFLLLATIITVAVILGCTSSPNVDQIVNEVITTHGGEAYDNSRIGFSFRDVLYTAEHQGGKFAYTRTFPDSLGGIIDSLTNEGFSRTIAGEPTTLSFEEDSAYSNSVNSVIYFALLPFKLNDAAVNKKLLGQTTINGEPYHEIRVTFDQEGGGTDYQDIFIYWMHRERYTMDYLVYRFQVDGGGTRFREARNVRTVNGIRFADYNNYGSGEMESPLHEYDTYFESDTLTKVSEINLENIEVELLND